MDIFSKIILAIVGTGFFGNLILYWVKRRDSNIDNDKLLLNPILDEVCNICCTVDSLIDKSNEVSKEIDKLHKKQLILFREADRMMSQYNRFQDELIAIYSKDSVTQADSINIKIIRTQSEECFQKRSEIMEEALSIPKEEENIISEFNMNIKKEITPHIRLSHRLTNTYKLSNKKNRNIVSQQLVKIDKALKNILKDCDSYHRIQIPPVIFFNLYKIITDCRFKLTQING